MKNLSKPIACGVRYLQQQLSPAGWWCDFNTLAGPATEWTTAYLLSGMANLREQQQSITPSHKNLLSSQRKSGGWGYNRQVPPDADSTAWTLISFHSLPCWRPSALQRALRYLIAHIDPKTGGCSTYTAADHIERYIRVPAELVSGWLQPHPCVTGVAVQALCFYGNGEEAGLIRNSGNYLLQQRGADHQWTSYWWQGKAYTSFHALKALLLTGQIQENNFKQSLVAIADTQDARGCWTDENGQPDVFNSAYYARILTMASQQKFAKVSAKVIPFFLDSQNSDGSWPVMPILRIPRPMVTDPQTVHDWRQNEYGTGVILADQNRLFTTISVLQTLHRLSRSAKYRH